MQTTIVTNSYKKYIFPWLDRRLTLLIIDIWYRKKINKLTVKHQYLKSAKEDNNWS